MVTRRLLARALAVVVLAVVAVLSGAATAQADGESCLYPPGMQNPAQGVAGSIDPGPAQSTDSTYSQLGYGGYDLSPVQADPCVEVLGKTFAQKPRASIGARVAGLFGGGTDIVTAVATYLARLIADGATVGTLMTAALGPVTTVFPWWAVAAAFAVGTCVSGVWLAFRSHQAKHARETVRGAIGIPLVAFAAFACLTLTAVLPAVQAKTIATSLSALQSVASGGNGRADVAVGDAMTDYVRMPSWAKSRFGDDPGAIETYGWRVRAATTMTRKEASYAATLPADQQSTYKASLYVTKANQYKAIAQEMKTTHPMAYAHLSGRDTTGIVGPAAFGFALAVLALLGLLACLAAIVAAQAVLPVIVVLFPIIAVAAQFPKWQRHAIAIGKAAWLWTLVGIGGAVGFVLWMAFPIRALGMSSGTWDRIVGLGALYLGLYLAFRFRWTVMHKIGVDKQVATTQVVAEVVAEKVADAVRRDDQQDDADPGEGQAVTDGGDDSREVEAPIVDTPRTETPTGDDGAFTERLEQRKADKAAERADLEAPDVDRPQGNGDSSEEESFEDRLRARKSRARMAAMEAQRFAELGAQRAEANRERELAAIPARRHGAEAPVVDQQ